MNWQEYSLLFAVCVFAVFALLQGTGEKKEGGRKPEPDEVTEDLVTIASYFNPGVAHIAKGKLESERIESYLANDSLFCVNPGLALADGGVHLRVRESDAEKALKILSGQA